MKKRTKILAGLSAAVLALSAVGFGFSQWSSNITLGGNVNVKGSWDVGITDAKIQNISAGTVVDGTAVDVVPTITVTAYNIYADYCTDFNPNWKEYRFQIDDENPITLELTQEEFNEYVGYYAVSGKVPAGYKYYMSEKEGANVHYKVKLTETAKELGWETSYVYHEIDDNGVHDGELLGVGFAYHIVSPDIPKNNPWGLKIYDHDALADELNANPPYSYYPATVDENKQTATYSGVDLTIPGAWAEYSVTVTNNGTVNANLNDYVLEVAGMDGDIVVNAPELTDEVLAPGASCTVTFVAQVPADYAEPTLDAQGTLSVHLAFAQATVEAAPAPSVTH